MVGGVTPPGSSQAGAWGVTGVAVEAVGGHHSIGHASLGQDGQVNQHISAVGAVRPLHSDPRGLVEYGAWCLVEYGARGGLGAFLRILVVRGQLQELQRVTFNEGSAGKGFNRRRMALQPTIY